MKPSLLAALLFAAMVGLGTVTAQAPIPPTKEDPKPIVFRPKALGEPLPPAPGTPRNPPVKKDGMILFRPQAPGSAPEATPAAPPVAPAATPKAEPAAPANLQSKTLFDYWFVAAVDGKRIGYLHWAAREIEKDGKKLWVGSKYQKLTVARFGQVVNQWGEEGTTETPEGEVLITTFSQGLGKDQALALTGVVEGKVLRVKGAGVAAAASDTPWPTGVTGVVREPLEIRDRKLKPGDSYDSFMYVASLNRVIKTTTTAEAEEELSLWPGTPPRKLLRLVSRMEPVGNFKLPAQYLWCDAKTYEPLKSEFKFAALGGKVTFLRTTQAAAMQAVESPPDVFKVQSIRLDREVPNIHNRGSLTYSIRMPEDDDPSTTLSTDSRQQVKNVDAKSKSFDLVVTAIRSPASVVKPAAAPGQEFLDSSFFVNWDNDAVKSHAKKATASLPAVATDWDKARAVETWVKQNMKAVEFSQAMATADNVANSLSGDCTEYAMLATAMCRAVGVPSRTALGLVYVPTADGKPYLAYHMWFEVFVEGQWIALDATLGQGGIGPGHIKITDNSWDKERTFAPLLPVLRVLMSEPAITVASEVR